MARIKNLITKMENVVIMKAAILEDKKAYKILNKTTQINNNPMFDIESEVLPILSKRDLELSTFSCQKMPNKSEKIMINNP